MLLKDALNGLAFAAKFTGCSVRVVTGFTLQKVIERDIAEANILRLRLVDDDGDGHRDLFHSIPDMLASTANFLKGHGWKAGEAWGEGTHNYGVIREWNKAEVYVKTIAIMAMRLSEAGAEAPPPVRVKNRTERRAGD